jgi:hypothetical protein
LSAHAFIAALDTEIDGARFGERLALRRNIDAVAENIATLDDDVVEIDPDAKRNAPVGQQCLVQLRTAPRKAAAQRTATTTLSNSMSTPSPVHLTIFPPHLKTCGSMISVCASSSGTSRL